MNVQRTIVTLSMAAMVTALSAAPAPVSGDHVVIDTQNLAKLSPAEQQDVQHIAARMNQLLSLDRSAMSREERKAVRSEMRTLKASAEAYNERGGGTVVYISTAGIIIILLLLIILL